MQQLVEVHGKKLTTSSVVIAEQFGRPHHMVLKSLDKLISKVRIDLRDYIDARGKSQRMYVLDERSFLISMPFIGGNKSLEGQIRLVDEFLRIKRLLHDPDQKIVVQTKRDANRLMNDALVEHRKQQDKATEAKHFITESKLCNWAITGKFEKVNETLLTVDELSLLAKVRRFNESLIMAGLDYKERKPRLFDYVERQTINLSAKRVEYSA